MKEVLDTSLNKMISAGDIIDSIDNQPAPEHLIIKRKILIRISAMEAIQRIGNPVKRT
ncbi:hypothetical protein [Pedobacter sp. NJ-S-72]